MRNIYIVGALAFLFCTFACGIAQADSPKLTPPDEGSTAKVDPADAAAEAMANAYKSNPSEYAFLEVNLYARLTGMNMSDHHAVKALFARFPLKQNYVLGITSHTATFPWYGWSYPTFAAAITAAGGVAGAPTVLSQDDIRMLVINRNALYVLVRVRTQQRLLGLILPDEVHILTAALGGSYDLADYSHDVVILDPHSKLEYLYSRLPAKGLSNPIGSFQTWRPADWYRLWNQADLTENKGNFSPISEARFTTVLVISQLPPKR